MQSEPAGPRHPARSPLETWQVRLTQSDEMCPAHTALFQPLQTAYFFTQIAPDAAFVLTLTASSSPQRLGSL